MTGWTYGRDGSAWLLVIVFFFESSARVQNSESFTWLYAFSFFALYEQTAYYMSYI